MYLLRAARPKTSRIQLMGSGAILGEILKAARVLEEEHDVAADVWSVTSFVELARDGAERERQWRHGERPTIGSWFEQRLRATQGPIVAATDYVRALAELVRAYVPKDRSYFTLGTDGFGRSDSRAALRRHFEVDAAAIVQTALRALAEEFEARGTKDSKTLQGLVSVASI
jgi:pyruvate dehydrogenase E1 component